MTGEEDAGRDVRREAGMESGRPAVPPSTPDLRLRAERPKVVRLSRYVVWGLAGTAMIGIGLALGYALQNSGRQGASSVVQESDARPSADGLDALPKDYTGVPKLGPPLPGDLGKPFLKAQQEGRAGPVSSMGDHRAEQEVAAAIASKLFVQTRDGGRQDNELPIVAPATGGTATAAQSGASDRQAANRAFLAGEPDRVTVSPDRLTPPTSPYVIQAGTVIAGALNTKVSSDLPGQLIGHVTQNVYDSPTGRYLLVPQGSTLFGSYNSSISFGQQRTQVIWTRFIRPDGESIVLDRMPGADAIGQTGLKDQVDQHWGQLFRAALVTTLLSVGSEAGTSWGENNLFQAIRSGASNGFSMVGNRLIDRSMDVQPTLTDRPGLPFTLIVNRDLVLKPWHHQEGASP
ncbi:TrbI/VirB10 family protein [Acetobacter oeni]|uniref:Conjugal transfer protein TrbI n=1 Tax=Acetobacter oeni TaxID=304077 RepID=A0A511XP57_9PROT|nr:TrbI/VirB10 family protein [Acetobacter oeni]MBB3884560.1 type IV secretion system protein VirB10 [Acetobacter oeni]NHO20490.1 conjugal transfer protein TrbI [Acetobacter oeni]GBR04496.1 conjugal transfer protein TrbI [Acetobacter oeni LMG 21952]GEN64741.1 conjugal transfer protein TrbI [Acetobacter oeni]